MIDSYRFGSIVIKGREYNSDVIIYQNRVDSNWWRKDGHSIDLDDLTEIINYDPDILIIGTGNSGLLKIPKETKQLLEAKGIELISENTNDACESYNDLYTKRNVIAALHLTC